MSSLRSRRTLAPLHHLPSEKMCLGVSVAIVGAREASQQIGNDHQQGSCEGRGKCSDCLYSRLAAVYDLGDVLGRGGVAVVRRATRHVDGRKVAIKCIACEDDEVRRFARWEYNLVQTLDHPAIVTMEAFYESCSEAWICMELFDDGSVQQFVTRHGPFTRHAVQPLIMQLLQGVNYLHYKRVVHRDLKPDNLVLRDGACKLKICDVNSAARLGGGPNITMLTDRGTRNYYPPELKFGYDWNERVDIWTCGLCIYFMMRASLPFNILHRHVQAELMSGKLPPIRWDGFSPITKNLTQQCLTVNKFDRPPAMELLQHPFFYKHRRPMHSRPRRRASSHDRQQDSCEAALGDWRERLDGSLHLSRLAHAKFKRTSAENDSDHQQEFSARAFLSSCGGTFENVEDESQEDA